MDVLFGRVSAADRIEAISNQARPGWSNQECAYAKTRLRAIAAELRGAPALTEAERAFFEAALEFCAADYDNAAVPWDRLDRAYRALRTERTPLEGT